MLLTISSSVSGVAAPSTENHRSFVGGVVRLGAKRTGGNRTSQLDHVAFDRDRTGRHLQICLRWERLPANHCPHVVAAGKERQGQPDTDDGVRWHLLL